MPRALPHFFKWDGPFIRRNGNQVFRTNWSCEAHPQALWNELRTELDDAKGVLRSLPGFVNQNLNKAESNLKERLEWMQLLFERYVTKVESVEQRFRDQLTIIASAKWVEMAELSIQESKRVMLCKYLSTYATAMLLKLIMYTVTALAFIFVPISLATSIFGMNIQEIDGTGHGLWVFIVTTVVLCVVAGALLGISSFIVTLRHT
jgi:Mg2+ and Co2+ transporter CorA